MAVRIYKSAPLCPRPLTATRATRRSLAQAVEVLCHASNRYRFTQTRRTRTTHVLALAGWPGSVYVDVSACGLAMVAMHENCVWDLLFWVDANPTRCKGGWRDTCGSSQLYSTLGELYWHELMRPFLAYLDRLPNPSKLELCAAKDRSVMWAQVTPLDVPTPANVVVVMNLENV